MRFGMLHLLLIVTLAGIGVWVFIRIGTKPARYEIVKMDTTHDQQWNKYWSRIKWKVHLPSDESGTTFTSFIEVDEHFDSAGYDVGDILSFRFQETHFMDRPVQNPKKMIVHKLFAVEGNVRSDNKGDIFAGPFPTVKKRDSEANWE